MLEASMLEFVTYLFSFLISDFKVWKSGLSAGSPAQHLVMRWRTSSGQSTSSKTGRNRGFASEATCSTISEVDVAEAEEITSFILMFQLTRRWHCNLCYSILLHVEALRARWSSQANFTWKKWWECVCWNPICHNDEHFFVKACNANMCSSNDISVSSFAWPSLSQGVHLHELNLYFWASLINLRSFISSCRLFWPVAR